MERRGQRPQSQPRQFGTPPAFTLISHFNKAWNNNLVDTLKRRRERKEEKKREKNMYNETGGNRGGGWQGQCSYPRALPFVCPFPRKRQRGISITSPRCQREMKRRACLFIDWPAAEGRGEPTILTDPISVKKNREKKKEESLHTRYTSNEELPSPAG